MSCIFCMIGKGEIPSQTVYENEYVRAFLDLSQAGKGHTLVVPKSTLIRFLIQMKLHIQS